MGLLGAALTGAGQVAALHSVREGVGSSPEYIWTPKMNESSNANRFSINMTCLQGAFEYLAMLGLCGAVVTSAQVLQSDVSRASFKLALIGDCCTLKLV